MPREKVKRAQQTSCIIRIIKSIELHASPPTFLSTSSPNQAQTQYLVATPDRSCDRFPRVPARLRLLRGRAPSECRSPQRLCATAPWPLPVRLQSSQDGLQQSQRTACAHPAHRIAYSPTRYSTDHVLWSTPHPAHRVLAVGTGRRVSNARLPSCVQLPARIGAR